MGSRVLGMLISVLRSKSVLRPEPMLRSAVLRSNRVLRARAPRSMVLWGTVLRGPSGMVLRPSMVSLRMSVREVFLLAQGALHFPLCQLRLLLGCALFQLRCADLLLERVLLGPRTSPVMPIRRRCSRDERWARGNPAWWRERIRGRARAVAKCVTHLHAHCGRARLALRRNGDTKLRVRTDRDPIAIFVFPSNNNVTSSRWR